MAYHLLLVVDLPRSINRIHHPPYLSPIHQKSPYHINFTSKLKNLNLGQAIGEVDPDEYKRLPISKTIEEHLDKEMRLRPQGIKVLSLFFIDKVANYRWYDKDGNPQKGKVHLVNS
ncbi:MAG: hypothetical protein KAG53_04350 [Endozoicomonadaceae bacterium]|nr:hypothetical protein [Endozoicomonadaceae bacterium]